MNENLPDFRGLSAFLVGDTPELPGKHIQFTSAFSLGTRFPIGCMGL